MKTGFAYAMVMPALSLLLLAAACNDGNGGEQDALSEDAVPDDTADTSQDDALDLQPEDPRIEDLQPDPDAVVDPVEEDALEEDTPADAEDVPLEDVLSDDVPSEDGLFEDVPSEDAPSEDVLEEAETPCEESGGYCWRFHVTFPACVTCPDRDGMPYLPAPPAQRALGCTVGGVGSSPWCCFPDWGSGTSVCEVAGGACYPDEGSDSCPIGWDATFVECDETSTVCCLPIPEC